ncbi:MAG: glycosyltransferase family 4 protein, partial [Chthoniobacterales bacterium]
SDACVWSSLPFARILHAAWPIAIGGLPAGALKGKYVVCQADNPPSFYLGTREFEDVVPRVDLWIARSQEAVAQFRLLGLPVAFVPYAVDPAIFRPLGNAFEIRHALGIPPKAFVIGNFHRDSEGGDLAKPKKQKGPDLFLEIARRLHARVPETVVLLAGPRRHWLLRALRAEGVPTVFAGEEPGDEDDYRRNILPRSRLNELYQALDVCLVSSRWEGGPYSVLEALAAGRDVVSTPVGVARDVLPPECRYTSIDEAVQILTDLTRGGVPGSFCKEAGQRAAESHGPRAVRDAYLAVYEKLPRGGVSMTSALASAFHAAASQFGTCKSSDLHQDGEWLREIRAHNAEADTGVIEYNFDSDRRELLRTAASIRALRISA